MEKFNTKLTIYCTCLLAVWRSDLLLAPFESCGGVRCTLPVSPMDSHLIIGKYKLCCST